MTVTDRLTGGFKLAGTDTYRRSCSKLLGFYGGNCQNPTPSLMRCIVPPSEYVFIQPDQSGAEALIVAMEAPRGKFRSCFDVGIKVHSYMALQLFVKKFAAAQGVAEDRYTYVDPRNFAAMPECKSLLASIKADSRAYDLGKRVIHAKNYAMGPNTFRLNCLEMSEGAINLSFHEAKHFLKAHENLFPEIIQWQASIRGEAAATRTLRNLFGYPKHFGTIWSDALERKLYAFKPQSTVGIITALAIVDMTNYISVQHLPWYVLNDKHDSFLLAVPDTEEHISHARYACKLFIERDLVSSHGEQFKMKSGISIGRNWSKFDAISNPEGMKEIE